MTRYKSNFENYRTASSMAWYILGRQSKFPEEMVKFAVSLESAVYSGGLERQFEALYLQLSDLLTLSKFINGQYDLTNENFVQLLSPNRKTRYSTTMHFVVPLVRRALSILPNTFIINFKSKTGCMTQPPTFRGALRPSRSAVVKT